MRPSGRQSNQLRPVKFTRSYTCHAEGSVLDLDHAEDSLTETDMNVVMNDAAGFIETQGAAEQQAFGRKELNGMLDLAEAGIIEIIAAQKAALTG